MNYDDAIWWMSFREVKRPYLENDEYRMVAEIHARIKGHPVDYPCKCNPKRIQGMIDDINLEYDKL